MTKRSAPRIGRRHAQRALAGPCRAVSSPAAPPIAGGKRSSTRHTACRRIGGQQRSLQGRRQRRRTIVHAGALTALISLLLMSSGAVGLGSVPAWAAPKATLQLKAIPIPGYRGTGNISGAGAEVESRVTISGSEYGGFPSPLTGINIFAPAGVKVNSAGFATCAPVTLEADGAVGCSSTSRAGPVGTGLGVVSFAGERVPEEVTIHEFFAPSGGLIFYVEGHTPAILQILEDAHWTTAGLPYGPELQVEVPLIETLPGADDASVLSFRVKVGAARRVSGKPEYYFTLPKHCPKGGFPTKMN